MAKTNRGIALMITGAALFAATMVSACSGRVSVSSAPNAAPTDVRSALTNEFEVYPLGSMPGGGRVYELKNNRTGQVCVLVDRQHSTISCNIVESVRE